MNTQTAPEPVEIEKTARRLAAETGRPIELCRFGIFFEWVRFACAMNYITLEEANGHLAPWGVSLSRRAK